MTTNTEFVAPIAAEAETAIRQRAAAEDQAVAAAIREVSDLLRNRTEALNNAAMALAGHHDSSIWEILYAAEWILGDFSAATSWVPADAGDNQ